MRDDIIYSCTLGFTPGINHPLNKPIILQSLKLTRSPFMLITFTSHLLNHPGSAEKHQIITWVAPGKHLVLFEHGITKELFNYTIIIAVYYLLHKTSIIWELHSLQLSWVLVLLNSPSIKKHQKKTLKGNLTLCAEEQSKEQPFMKESKGKKWFRSQGIKCFLCCEPSVSQVKDRSAKEYLAGSGEIQRNSQETPSPREGSYASSEFTQLPKFYLLSTSDPGKHTIQYGTITLMNNVQVIDDTHRWNV